MRVNGTSRSPFMAIYGGGYGRFVQAQVLTCFSSSSMRVRISPGVSPFEVDESSATHSKLPSGKQKRDEKQSRMFGVGSEFEKKMLERIGEFVDQGECLKPGSRSASLSSLPVFCSADLSSDSSSCTGTPSVYGLHAHDFGFWIEVCQNLFSCGRLKLLRIELMLQLCKPPRQALCNHHPTSLSCRASLRRAICEA
jgi:hypothetical protein